MFERRSTDVQPVFVPNLDWTRGGVNTALRPRMLGTGHEIGPARLVLPASAGSRLVGQRDVDHAVQARGRRRRDRRTVPELPEQGHGPLPRRQHRRTIVVPAQVAAFLRADSVVLVGDERRDRIGPAAVLHFRHVDHALHVSPQYRVELHRHDRPPPHGMVDGVDHVHAVPLRGRGVDLPVQAVRGMKRVVPLAFGGGMASADVRINTARSAVAVGRRGIGIDEDGRRMHAEITDIVGTRTVFHEIQGRLAPFAAVVRFRVGHERHVLFTPVTRGRLVPHTEAPAVAENRSVDARAVPVHVRVPLENGIRVNARAKLEDIHLHALPVQCRMCFEQNFHACPPCAPSCILAALEEYSSSRSQQQ